MSAYDERQFIMCLKRGAPARSERELDIIYAYLHGMEALSNLREPALRSLCSTVRYEFHDANDILYCQGELATCWYILLSGSVFIEGSMFLPRSSFGKRSQGCARRTSECLTLEPSEMIVIDYPDIQGPKSQHRLPCVNANLDRLLSMEHPGDATIRRMNSDSILEQLPADLQGMPALYPGGHYQLRGDACYKRSSRASDTSSAYSGSDMMQSSIDDQENVEMELSGLVESAVDSDDEDGYAESTESQPIRDAVHDVLEKDPSERTEDDIEILLDFMQHFRAFANMTQATRRALCGVMVFAVVEKAGDIVMNDGEELDSWSVILNGEVEIMHGDGSRTRKNMGDSFGITPTMEKLYHQGVMRTVTDDCQFVCIPQQEYYRILHQGEENTKKHEEEGEVVMVTEHRELDGGNRRGHIVIRGTPERLMQHLVEDHSAIDPTYVEDFLLTYRVFQRDPMVLASRLLDWFNSPPLRSKVTRVVLLWVNNHFNDFETDPLMCEFLEKFESLLEQEKMMGQMRLLNIACAAKARTRTITLTRSTRDEILHFSILGGCERGHGIFITKVEKGSKAYESGLKRGDQILEVNGNNFNNISHSRALDILRGTTHLSITVKSNLHEFKEMLQASDKNTPRKAKREDFIVPRSQRLSAPDLDAVVPVISPSKEKKDKEKKSGLMTFGNRRGLRKALMKMNIIPRAPASEQGNMNHSDESLYSKPSRKSSTSSTSSSNTGGMSNHLSASNPDLSTLVVPHDDPRHDFPEHVVKVYKSDQSFKYLLIHKETTAKEVVMLALQEFGITEPSCHFSLCEVTVESEKLIKTKKLPDQLQNLPDRLNLNGRRTLPRVTRYYLKNNMCTETLVPTELMAELMKESQVSLLQLNTAEVASQLTLEDFKVFREIEPTEYIDELFKINSKYGCPMLQKFNELVNKEMFWVVTEVCSETNPVKRMKLVKHFIKIAKHCKDCKNFNTMFAILSGLGHRAVSRLRGTWERLPSKYCKMFEDLESLMDPSRNMAKYRNLINSEHVQPPMLPFFPIVKKDLTFIHLGNDSYVERLVNFEKLRMIAKEVRHICNMCSARYDVSTMFLGTSSMYPSSSLVSGVATLKRTKNRRGSTIPNPKKMYEEAQMVRRVKSYLSNMPVNPDEEELKRLSHVCEQPARRRDPSPGMGSGAPNTPEEKRHVHAGPKFGAESPEAVRKMMALSEKVRPHNPKKPVPNVTSPVSGRRQQTSPRHSRAPLPVHLSAESSSVLSLSNLNVRKPSRTGSMGSTDSASPPGSVGSGYQHQYSSETDSGHNSVISSNYDSRSMSSVGSCNSPPASRRTYPGVSCSTLLPPPPFPVVRPPLPSYSVVMQNMPPPPTVLPNQQYYPVGHPNPRRPPLPDYHTAAQMAAHRQKQQQWSFSPGQEAIPTYAYTEGDYDEAGGEGAEEEQVSAV